MAKWGIGVDIEELSKVRKAITNKSFVTRTFTRREVEYCMSKGNLATHYAGIFAAKEAVYKALSSIFSHDEMIIDMASVEILHAKSGEPIVRLTKPSNKFRRLEIKVTISHSNTYAIAVAFARQAQRKT